MQSGFFKLLSWFGMSVRPSYDRYGDLCSNKKNLIYESLVLAEIAKKNIYIYTTV